MNRKLHHSLTAAMACSAVLAAVLLASTPLESDPLPTVARGTATPPATAHAGKHRAASRSYQSVRMPFFSFFIPKG